MNNKLLIVLSVTISFSIFSYSIYDTKAEGDDGMVDWSAFEAAINDDATKQNLDYIIRSKEKIEEQNKLKKDMLDIKNKAKEVRNKHQENIKLGNIKQDKIIKDIKERKGFVDSALSTKSSETTATAFSTIAEITLE